MNKTVALSLVSTADLQAEIEKRKREARCQVNAKRRALMDRLQEEVNTSGYLKTLQALASLGGVNDYPDVLMALRAGGFDL